MDKFVEMQTFAAVVDSGSFVKAADALSMSKAAVSRYVGDLETRLGVRLLHRTTRKLSLTAEGQVFHVRCKELLSGIDDAEAEISVHSGEATGHLKVNVPVTFGLMHLAPLWAEFLALHPKVKLDVTLTDRVVDLVDEGYDLAVRIALLPSSSLVSRQLTSTRLVLCATPAYLQLHGVPRHPLDLAHHSIIAYSLLATGDAWELVGPQGRVSVKVSPRMHTNSGDTCRVVALQHRGIVLQPTFLVGQDLLSDGLSEFPHLIVNQARLQQYMLDYMRMSPTRLEANYGLEFVTLKVESVGTHPVVVTLRDVARGSQSTVRAKYVVGCDGARSMVRDAIGAVPQGDFANHAWGVVDMLAVTDFPDIRLKAAIQSGDEGNILLIPREGGYMVRLYVDMGEIDPNNRDAFRNHTQEDVIATAGRVLRPYTLDVKRVVWFAVYQVGQRVTDRFDDVPADQVGSRLPRVFIAGDACHTHSAKAGQGMNVSMQDTFNLGWKLASVLNGCAKPELLRTYNAERQAIAQGLIDFDKEWSKIMASPPKDPKHPELGGVDPQELQAYFVKSGRYTAGVATHYAPTTVLTAKATHQALAKGFTIGMRFHSAPVVRLADAKPVQLGHAARADGAWRIYAFADASGKRLRELAAFLAESPKSPIRRFTPTGPDIDIDSVIDVRAVFQQPHRELKVEELPSILLPRKGAFGLIDYEKAYCPDLGGGPDIFDLRGIDRTKGALVVVRPDQYVSNVLPLDAHGELAAFFGQFLLDRQ